MDAVISLRDVSKIYGKEGEAVRALDGVSLCIGAGEYVSIMGPSGSGKSTCMNLIGCLDRPTAGEVRINGENTADMSERALAALRNRTVGFVFQQYHLLPSMTALENVMLPLRYKGIEPRERREIALAALEKVSMLDRARYYPAELSGGQKQRAAIARAAAASPRIILADEPTGALDSVSGERVMELFSLINRGGAAVILVTHDSRIASFTRRRIVLRDGAIAEDTGAPGAPEGEARRA